MELGKTYELVITGYDMNGLGVANKDNVVIFVEKALKGEKVLAEITNLHKKYAFAKTVKVLEESTDRIVSPCEYYEGCGGCDLLHMNYEIECLVKEEKVKNSFKKICNLTDININPIIRNNNVLGYRNKVMVPFGKDDDDNVIYGFYEKLSHEIVSIDKCLISNDESNKVLEFIRRYLSVMNIKIYNEATNKGLFRSLMIRNNYKKEMMLVFVTTQYYDFSGLIEYLKSDFPLVKSIYLNINPNKTNVVLSDNYVHLYGEEYLLEDILGLKFNVSPASFMQVNHDNAEKLYSEAFRMANLNKDMNVIDAYCGMGSITLNIAKHVNHVYGIEIVEDAIKNANKNKELNNISNATFICGKCEEEIKKLTNLTNIDVIFFDPPRKGCDQEFLKTVVEMNIPKIVYISCGIASLCRDINYLKEHNYEVIEVTPTDLFSRTSHVETVVSLVLRDKTK